MQSLPAGDVEELRVIGSGGFGLVYRGRSKKLGMEVAVKILNRESCLSAEFCSLMKEKDMMMKANSTYVLRVLAVYEDEDKGHIEYGLVMEYMPHGSLHSLFNTFNKKEVLIPWPLRFQILHQVAIAMNFLHGLNPAIIHQDLKPQNVLLRKDLDVQLTDFGLARNETSAPIGMAGTVSYMPPESFVCLEYKPTKEFDVYSFAILIWWILSGREPYNAINREIIICRIPVGMRPDMTLVDCWKTEKMVPEAIEMMKQCWDGEPSKRLCFSELDSSKINNFIRQLNRERSGKQYNKTAGNNTSSEDILIEDPIKFLKKNFSKIIQEKPAWKSILDDLFTQDIFKEEQVDSIVKDHRTVQDQIRETLRVIIKQGKNSCMTLVQLMNRHHPSLMSKMEI
ncbi:ankyrin repeat and protein kinase domain-containing protein 1-like isoform X3 [Rana temporaria]|uniref:ankyrin repeat and protein kinase domain-containing protein 1-like isoform X3 n=1 Tax=Rana temporaria TaxID=8407 RepID=UPI001AADC7C4|nr:ankyrin repeat and protein kinase domain-containing protein 1-like isoform X3 [Rana temporaria]